MSNKKEISLCMVIYNQSELAQKAIESVREIVNEIIIVDQGSSDVESEVLKSLSDIYVRTTNKGNADYDRQFCYSLATKDYILALDADEIVETSEIEKIKSLLLTYDFDVVWFLFQNFIWFDNQKVNISDLLGDDPHPRLWKRQISISGRQVETLIWPYEAHKFPEINSGKQIFAESFFLHSRNLINVIKTHIHRGKNISPENQQLEKEFIRAILNKFSIEIKKRVSVLIPELSMYLR